MPYDSREYYDMVRERTGDHANINPSAEIGLGAYGEIDKDTGGWRTEGNIFGLPELKEMLRSVERKDYPAVIVQEVLYSNNAKKLKDSADVNL